MITHNEPVYKHVLCMQNSCARNCVVEGKMVQNQIKVHSIKSKVKPNLQQSL